MGGRYVGIDAYFHLRCPVAAQVHLDAKGEPIFIGLEPDLSETGEGADAPERQGASVDFREIDQVSRSRAGALEIIDVVEPRARAVRARMKNKPIASVTTDQVIGARSTRQQVAATISPKIIGACTARNRVVSVAAEQPIWSSQAVQLVTAGPTLKLVVRTVAGEAVPAGPP